MQKLLLSVITLLLLSLSTPKVSAQQFVGFETPTDLKSCTLNNGGILELNKIRSKAGQAALLWEFQPNSGLSIELPQNIRADAYAMRSTRQGIQMWIYNPLADHKSIKVSFLNKDNEPLCYFYYIRATKGWRAAWTDFTHIFYTAPLKDSMIRTIRFTAPDVAGKMYLDRLLFPVKSVNVRTTPDAQMISNNSLPDRPLWHWCRVWEWEQVPRDMLPAKTLSGKRIAQLDKIQSTLRSELLDLEKKEEQKTHIIQKGKDLYASLHFEYNRDGTLSGPHLVAPDEMNKADNDIHLKMLNDMMQAYALDYLLNHNQKAIERFFELFRYGMEEGFAWGSGMGTNHHYGYKIRDIYRVSYLLRDEIMHAKDGEEMMKALAFWAGLNETRQPCRAVRDERVDTWHTLLEAKLIMSLFDGSDLTKDLRMRELRRWLGSSLNYTSGTIGGIKPDGTVFHHGGFYPAYTTGAIAAIAQYMHLTRNTDYMLAKEDVSPLAKALEAATFYSELRQFPITLGGRHPFVGTFSMADLEAWAEFALSYPNSSQSRTLAGYYLHVLDGQTTSNSKLLIGKGYRSIQPTGYNAYNYGATAAYRYKQTLALMKGYNHHVWGAEIYVKDNRYGRYLSYGSLVLQEKNRAYSGYGSQDGFDWARIPGTTARNIPLEVLDCPFPKEFMYRNKSAFAGALTQDNRSGVFAIEIQESGFKNFDPSFHARKSYFAFGPYILCVGSDISSNDPAHNIETTLFQVMTPKSTTQSDSATLNTSILTDGYGHYYITPSAANIKLWRKHDQHSRDDKYKKETHGTWDVAVWDHGKAPQQASYIYVVLPQSSEKEAKAFKPESAYKLLAQTPNLHGMKDIAGSTYAYAAFAGTSFPDEDPLLSKIDKEALLIWKKQGKDIILSVCDPDLNLGDMSYTTPLPSQAKTKIITLRNGWRWHETNDTAGKVSQQGNMLTVKCLNGEATNIQLTQ